MLASQDLKQQEFFLGCSKVSGKVDWKMLDEAVFQVFQVKGHVSPQGWLVLPPHLRVSSPVFPFLVLLLRDCLAFLTTFSVPSSARTTFLRWTRPRPWGSAPSPSMATASAT